MLAVKRNAVRVPKYSQKECFQFLALPDLVMHLIMEELTVEDAFVLRLVSKNWNRFISTRYEFIAPFMAFKKLMTEQSKKLAAEGNDSIG